MRSLPEGTTPQQGFDASPVQLQVELKHGSVRELRVGLTEAEFTTLASRLSGNGVILLGAVEGIFLIPPHNIATVQLLAAPE